LMENRLHQHSNGSFEVIPKTLAEVFGEQIVRPTLETIYNLSIGIFENSKNAFYGFDRLLSKTVNFLPEVEAQSLKVTESESLNCQETQPLGFHNKEQNCVIISSIRVAQLKRQALLAIASESKSMQNNNDHLTIDRSPKINVKLDDSTQYIDERGTFFSSKEDSINYFLKHLDLDDQVQYKNVL